ASGTELDEERATSRNSNGTGRTAPKRSGKNAELQAVTVGVRDGHECVSKRGQKLAFERAALVTVDTRAADKARCGGGLIGRQVGDRGPHLPADDVGQAGPPAYT